MTGTIIRKVFCNTCLGTTTHERVYSHQESEPVLSSSGEPVAEWLSSWDIYKCNGCGTVTFRQYSTLDGDPDIASEFLFPPRIARKVPGWAEKTPGNIQNYLEQVYQALHTNSRWLVSCGVRSIVDLVIRDKVGDQNSFAEGVGLLVEGGFIGRKQGEHLSAAIEAGHASIHRGYEPTQDDTNLILDIVENLLQAAYVLDAAAERLREVTPPRER